MRKPAGHNELNVQKQEAVGLRVFGRLGRTNLGGQPLLWMWPESDGASGGVAVKWAEEARPLIDLLTDI